MGKAIKKIARIAAPAALAYFAPGLGSAIGGSILGTGAAGSATLGSGLLGAGVGALTGGGLKGALTGGLSGALGANIGSFGGAPAGSFDSLGREVISSPSGSGILGALGKATGITSDSFGGLSGALGGGGSSFGGNTINSILSAGLGTNANDEAEKALLKQQQANQGLYAPYLNAKFEPGDLTQDPGYQFRLQQGEQALGRQQAARGNYFSGEAGLEAQKLGQGLADTTYNDAYNRFLAQNQANVGVANAASGINTDMGNIQANSITNSNNLLSGALAGLFGGNPLSNTGQSLGNGDTILIGGVPYKRSATGQYVQAA
jgi:hypothetical protein